MEVRRSGISLLVVGCVHWRVRILMLGVGGMGRSRLEGLLAFRVPRVEVLRLPGWSEAGADRDRSLLVLGFDISTTRAKWD